MLIMKYLFVTKKWDYQFDEVHTAFACEMRTRIHGSQRI